MALWRDPLDDLITDLEQALPNANAVEWDLPPLEGVQLLVSAILYGNEADVERVSQDPRVKAFLAYNERIVRRRGLST